jgi:hypothetical protein
MCNHPAASPARGGGVHAGEKWKKLRAASRRRPLQFGGCRPQSWQRSAEQGRTEGNFQSRSDQLCHEAEPPVKSFFGLLAPRRRGPPKFVWGLRATVSRPPALAGVSPPSGGGMLPSRAGQPPRGGLPALPGGAPPIPGGQPPPPGGQLKKLPGVKNRGGQRAPPLASPPLFAGLSGRPAFRGSPLPA